MTDYNRVVLPSVAFIIAGLLVACSPSGPTPTPTPTPTAAATGAAVVQASSVPASATPWPSVSPSLSLAATDPGPTLAPNADYAPLDGVFANPGVRMHLPVAIMIDDNVQARPQYGFNAASIVYQAPADGGETRYMMVFQEKDAKRVEPVRSGRPYFVDWATEYRSALAHYGGDYKTREYLPTIDNKYMYDIDALAGSGPAFHRDKTRKAPHNAVTSSTSVRTRAVKEGAPATMVPGLGVRPFADDLPADQRPARGSIKVPYNRGATSYTYDKASNRYLRSVAGKAQIDAADGKRVTARNVVVLYMRYSVDSRTEPDHNRPVFDHVGSGNGLVFRDGHVIKATWRKPSAHDLTRFYDAAGNEISLVRGRIFIQVVPTGTKVTYDAAP